ncbi:MAG: hypothetical protein PHF11_06820, partial [Candidatus Omnitrophica bacterium]|nr:hypothetical protein [Candidatus Omnitrophota bacterium]
VFMLVFTGVLFALNKNRLIQPITSENDVVLTRSLFSALAAFDSPTERLVHMVYIAGFFDAVQMMEANMPEANSFFQDCQGMTIGELTDAMLKFYREYPELKDASPAKVLTVAIPRIKKGLTPFPAPAEQKQ